MEIKINTTVLQAVQGDITLSTTEAIVNAANSSLMGGGGVDGAIHRAGGPTILEQCQEIRAKQGKLPTGQAVITTGGNLKVNYVIHTVGPIWKGGSANEEELLSSCYQNCLKIAKENHLSNINFPAISTGVYGYPASKAAKVALNTVTDFINNHPGSFNMVVFTLFDNPSFQYYQELLKKLSI